MENMPPFSYVPSENEIQFPLFKFQKVEHAKKMLSNGEVYISNLYDFKKAKYGGKIDDKTEGEVRIENYYENFNGLAEDVESVMLLNLGPGEKKLRNVILSANNVNPDALIYCTTAYLFSDTLSWAIEEGKDSCVMITDSKQFFNQIHQKLKDKYPYYKFGSCLYVKSIDGRFEEPNARKNSLTNKILHDRFIEYLLKPKEFIPQREVRGIYRNSSESLDIELKPETLIIPEIKKILVEIIFKDVDVEILKGEKKGRIKMSNILKSGEEYPVCFESPCDLMTPLIYNDNGVKIGFSTPIDKKFKGGEVHGDPAMYLSSLRFPIFGCANLNDLSHIEISTK